MKKIICCLLLCITITKSVWGLDEEDLLFFDKHLQKYKRQTTYGKVSTLAGVTLSITGGLLATTGITLYNSNIYNDNNAIMVSGYITLGVGALLFIVGLPIWLHAQEQYYDILERRQKYFIIINEN